MLYFVNPSLGMRHVYFILFQFKELFLYSSNNDFGARTMMTFHIVAIISLEHELNYDD